jgi:hypothetical protein
MSTLTSGELNRLRHIIAEQANGAQLEGRTDYLHLSRLDAQDVASALEELVALRTQEEDMARRDREKTAIIAARFSVVGARVALVQDALTDLIAAVDLAEESAS